MKKLYEKNELRFALLWILLYCLLTIPVRGRFGDASPLMLLALLALSAGITVFLKRNQLMGEYGLDRWPSHTRRWLYFLPMWILCTGNLWSGFGLSETGPALVCATLSMMLVGYVEEMLFRGFLFRALLKRDGLKAAVIISALTFGIGHIVNLFAGQTSLRTVLQVVFAISWGFLFTMVYYRCGSLWPGMAAHGFVNACSKYARQNDTMDLIHIASAIVIAALYCLWLARLRTPEEHRPGA